MPSLKEKIAALRAKRTARQTPNQSTAHGTSLPPLPPVSKLSPLDTDDVELTDDDEDEELIVLPPPAPHPVAQRHLWKLKEVRRAREKVVKSIAESYPTLFALNEVPVEQCTEESNAADGGADDNGEGDNVGPDEEELALEEAENSEDDPSNDDDDGQDEEDEEEKELAVAAKECVNSDDQTGNEDEPESPQTIIPEERKTSGPSAGHEENESDEKAVSDDVETKLKSNSALGKSSHNEKGVDASKNESRIIVEEQCFEHEASENSLEPNEKKSVGKHAANRIVEDVSKQVADSTQTRRPSFAGALIEQEADDEDENQNGGRDPSQLRDDGGVDGAHSSCSDGDDAEVKDDSPSKMAAFHHKWVLENDSRDANGSRSGSHRPLIEDVDDAMDFTALAEGPDVAGGETDNRSVVSEGEEKCNNSDGTVQRSDYIEEMFLRDDSRSRFLEEEEAVEKAEADDDDQNSRDKARALWKVRKKLRSSLFEEDENSLSRFDVFGDADKSRSAHFRMKLESACRSAPADTIEDARQIATGNKKTGMKRPFSWAGERSMPDWERRKACMQEKARKRQRSVSVGNWSFAAHGEGRSNGSKPPKANSSSKRPISLGATCLSRKSRSRSLSGTRSALPSLGHSKSRAVSKPSAGPTSFKGILNVLGARAELDP